MGIAAVEEQHETLPVVAIYPLLNRMAMAFAITITPVVVYIPLCPVGHEQEIAVKSGTMPVTIPDFLVERPPTEEMLNELGRREYPVRIVDVN
jgi:hypothetical protein